MVDVGGKPVTSRRAVAGARYRTRADVIDLLRDDALPKADVLTTARLAGISGAKKTSELIPLCHPVPIDAVHLDFTLEVDSVVITATATTSGRTGVEMEALTAAAIAGLTLHDMIKAVDPQGDLTDVRLLSKSGGKRGDWRRADASGADLSSADLPGDSPAGLASHPSPQQHQPSAVRPGTAIVLVASTRSAAGTRSDETGPTIAQWLATRGFAVDAVRVVADAAIAGAVRDALSEHPAALIITGGTGVSPDDRTPEAVHAVLDTELPGIAEAVRARGLAVSPTAALSRAVAGVASGTVVVALPGSRGGVRDGLAVLDGLLEHLVQQVAGGGTHE
jgi:cyclic pyranopterin phosphate synthase